MEEKQDDFAGENNSPQNTLFQQKLALDNMRRFRDRYEKTAADLFLSYERKKREEDFVAARDLLKQRGFYLKLQSFTEGILSSFEMITMENSLAWFLFETADALKKVETENDPNAKRKLEDMAKVLAKCVVGGNYVPLFPKEKPFSKWKRLQAEKKKSAQELLAETEAEYGIKA